MSTYFVVFGTPLLVCWLAYISWQYTRGRRAIKKLAEAKESGLTEPVSLHPVIDPNKCLGCGSCVSACPEGEILGLIKRKAALVEPTACIGHGACREACPTNAISLVFGTETRGVEIPLLTPEFESSVPGIYIAGELGGMGLIRNAISQGTQAIDGIARKRQKNHGLDCDVIIIGAGPAGLSSALAAKEKRLKYLCLEQDTIGGTIAHFPRGKIVMTQPADLPLVGKFIFREASKENLVSYWKKVVRDTRLAIKTKHRVDTIDKIPGGFTVKTNQGNFTTKTVLLTMGRRGTPRKLDVPGEDLPKVVYRLIDPEQYVNKRVLVVGGGDSALEAAISIAKQPGAETTLSYRGPAFSRAKPKNRQAIEAAEAEGRLNVIMESNVKHISQSHVQLNTQQGDTQLSNDVVLVCAGGVLPTPFLKKIGINVEEKFGTA